MYKEIFVAPKEKKLTELKEKEKEFDQLLYHGTKKQYEKILNIYNEQEEKNKQQKLKFGENPDLIKEKQIMHLKEDVKIKQGEMPKLSPKKESEKVFHDNIS